MATTPDLGALEARLRAAAPSIAVSGDTSAFAVDGLEPTLVVAPASAADAAAVLHAAAEAGAAVIPWGAGTHIALGMPPGSYDLAMDLRRLDRVVEYEPADLTVSVEAGIRLSELQRRLAEHGQWLPLDPAVDVSATVGGVLAANLSGPSRARYGTARDLLIGIRFATPDGEIVHAGGRVVKNVAGYDLGKLQIGALGTLGVIVEATFKVSPLPDSTRRVVVRSGSASVIMSTTLALRDLNLAVSAFVMRCAPGEGAYSLEVRCAGGLGAVERSVREIEAVASSAGLPCETLEAQTVAASEGTNNEAQIAVRARCSVTPSATAEILDALAGLDARIESYPTAGIVYATWADGSIDSGALRLLRELCVIEGRGALVLEVAPTALKEQIDVWGDTPPGFELMRNLKAEFDPDRTLNPGRFLGGI